MWNVKYYVCHLFMSELQNILLGLFEMAVTNMTKKGLVYISVKVERRKSMFKMAYKTRLTFISHNSVVKFYFSFLAVWVVDDLKWFIAILYEWWVRSGSFSIKSQVRNLFIQKLEIVLNSLKENVLTVFLKETSQCPLHSASLSGMCPIPLSS